MTLETPTNSVFCVQSLGCLMGY